MSGEGEQTEKVEVEVEEKKQEEGAEQVKGAGDAVEKKNDDARESRGRDRSRSRSRSRKKRAGSRSDSDSDSRSRSRKKSRRKHKKKHKKHKKSRRSSSSSESDSEDAGWEKKFLATAMENAQKARMGPVAADPMGAMMGGAAAMGPGAGVSGNKAIGRFFDNQGRFINPAGGFNPSGAPRRIPKEHANIGDWECESCGGHNRKHRQSCFTCFVPKPPESKAAVYTSSVGGRPV
eukprot:CAMPEP_0197617472 /NCGR_PEP_ID=MMETSP1326-20131121/61048_1 /TAXON_ID=1155430 /ORGANISM="Genus nov. species nov., Strain RCC2288" /LENGTH=233 /DNA_ID=CAMNT_0043186363 /DNA_START=191 /DNA_END=892 /DNA_ORIENTATION=+